MKRRAAVALVLCAAVVAGCAGTPIHIHNAVPADVDRSTGRIVEGDAYGFQAILLIPMGVNTRHARAWRDLLEKAGDSYVTDVQLKEGWLYCLVGTLYHTTLRATAYPKTKTAAR